MQIDDLITRLHPRLEILQTEMQKPEFAADGARMKDLSREYRRLKSTLDLHLEIAQVQKEIDGLKEAGNDPDLRALAEEELPGLAERLTGLERRLKLLLVPEEPEDARNAVLEIRAGAGGEEAALFAADLYKMYSRYFEKRRWKTEVISGHFSDLGGVREILVDVTGDGVYGTLKMESGVHRVQRVPVTEAQGRLHTSAASVAVLPEAEEIDVQVNPDDLKIDTYRASGAGGQHINKTESAVRITHLPSGLVVTCQDERSQLKNKHQAMKVLRAKLFQMKIDSEQARRAAQRRSQVSTGDRSAKIRTYHFPQNRVTDHRIPVTIYNLQAILDGELDLLLAPLSERFAEERLAGVLGGETL